MSALLRQTRELSWQINCPCCSQDAHGGRIRRKWRRQMKHTARRKEERRWVSEAREEQ